MSTRFKIQLLFPFLVIAVLISLLILSIITTTAPEQKDLRSNTAAGTPDNYYGVNWHPIWYTHAWQERALDAMHEAGAQTARVDVRWDLIETRKGSYDTIYLHRIDYAVNGMGERNIEPLLIVLGSPKWANGSLDPKVPPLYFQDYANFVGFLLHRYAGKVHAFEVWNEPDTETSWINPDPTAYTALLKTTYIYAKTIDPHVIIAAGSLSNVWTQSQNFLKDMYAAGAKEYFDVLSAHVYADPPSHGNETPNSAFDNFATNILPIMIASSDSTKHIWITEHGYNTSTNGVSQEMQANYLTQAYLKAQTVGNIDRLYYYEMVDSGTESTNGEHNYGLVTPNTVIKKSAFSAFQNLAVPTKSTHSSRSSHNNNITSLRRRF